MKKTALVCAAAALLSACGGGGGDSGNPNGPGFQAPSNRLAGYVGNWASACSNHEIENVTITSPASDTLTIATRTDYYAGANCSGAIVAVETEGGDITARYIDTVDAPIVFTQGTAATTGRVDRISASAPIRSRSITGTGVRRDVINGRQHWCIDFGGGSQTCVQDEGATPAQTGVAGGLHLQGTTMYELVLEGAVYTAYGRYQKR